MAILDDAIELVCWYESQPDCGTYKTDAQIAERLGWFMGGITKPKYHPGRNSLDRSSGLPKSDMARVRRARRFVDQHNKTQPFLGYSFGTRRNGTGRTFSMLITPNGVNAPEAVDEAASEQMGRAVQQANQAAAERARMIDKFAELEESFVREQKFDHAFCVHDAANQLREFGTIRMLTIQEARRLGILALSGAATE